MDEFYLYLVPWLVLAGLVAALAVAWNRSGARWLLLSVLLSPLVGFIALVVSGKRPEDAPPDRLKIASSSPLTWILLGLVAVGIGYILLNVLT